MKLKPMMAILIYQTEKKNERDTADQHFIMTIVIFSSVRLIMLEFYNFLNILKNLLTTT